MSEPWRDLVRLVAQTRDDEGAGCECCHENLAEFAERELQGLSRCETLMRIAAHLQDCPCCQDEYQRLTTALKAVWCPPGS
ncbi:MAG: hypothetical protein KDA83_03180 [Planctomycetales bacterium]|nr:hypothetical protein [Planctomycetales bacterium]